MQRAASGTVNSKAGERYVYPLGLPRSPPFLLHILSSSLQSNDWKHISTQMKSACKEDVKIRIGELSSYDRPCRR